MFFSRYGDPSILDDVELLKEFFTIPSGTQLYVVAKDLKDLTTAELAKKLKLFMEEGPEPDARLYDAAVHLVLSTIGIIKSSQSAMTIDIENIDVDYGYGKGTSTTTRDAISVTSRTMPTDEVVERRCRSVVSVLISMMCRGMAKTALEVFIVLSEQNVVNRKIPGPHSEREAHDIIYDTSKGAPPFAKYMRLCQDHIHAATKTKRKRDNADFEMCDCGMPLLRVVVHDSARVLTKTVYALCAVWIITEEGCKKIVRYDEK